MTPFRISLLLSLLLASCQPIPPAPPTSTVVTPTSAATPIKPTATPFPKPTATLVLPTAKLTPSSTPVPQLEVQTVRLPAPVYFLSGASGSQQIWRVAAETHQLTQITRFSFPVDLFDVSPTTGQMAYLANNELWLAEANGEQIEHITLNVITHSLKLTDLVESLAWSPDGKRLALAGQNGVWLYRPSDKRLTQLYANPPNIFSVRLNLPETWSSDGQALLLKLFYARSDASGVGVLSLVNANLTLANGLSTCSDLSWSNDSQYVYSAFDSLGLNCPDPGLLRWDRRENTTSALLSSTYPVPIYFVRAAQEGADGRLYYFYGAKTSANSALKPSGLSLRRSAQTDLITPSRLRSDAYPAIAEALWSPDVNLVVIVESAPPGFAPHGTLILLTTDNQPAVVLAEDGYLLRWGK